MLWEWVNLRSLKVSNILEGQDNSGKSTASKKGIFTLDRWCRMNGHNGVNEDCIKAAIQSQDPKINKMAKRAKLQSIVKGE